MSDPENQPNQYCPQDSCMTVKELREELQQAQEENKNNFNISQNALKRYDFSPDVTINDLACWLRQSMNRERVLREALLRAEHELTISNNLLVTDKPKLIMGNSTINHEIFWRMDNIDCLDVIRKALKKDDEMARIEELVELCKNEPLLLGAIQELGYLRQSKEKPKTDIYNSNIHKLWVKQEFARLDKIVKEMERNALLK